MKTFWEEVGQSKTKMYDYSELQSFQSRFGIYYGTFIGAAFGKIYSDLFVMPKARYLPKMIMLFYAGWGYKYGLFQRTRGEFRFLTANYKYLPQNVRDALETGDSRYMRGYLKEKQ